MQITEAAAFVYLKPFLSTAVTLFVDLLCFPFGKDGEELQQLICSALNRSVFGHLSKNLLHQRKSLFAASCFNKWQHSCSVLQGLFLLFCSALSSFALHLEPSAVNISTVVRLAPFIINRSPSAGKKTFISS